MKFFSGILFTLGVIIIIGLLAVYSGWYNVSAVNRPSGFENWLLGTTMDNSVLSHSNDIEVPDLKSHEMIEAGFAHYNEMCAGCHGAPGRKQTELSKGLNPPAPDLSESVQDMTPQALFWVTKNGIKMTGMPAWGLTHSDDKIWLMVAFIEKLPGMTGSEYDSLETHIKPMEEEH